MGTVALDPFANFFKVLILLSTALVILMSFSSKELKEYRVGEYFSILSIMTFGLFLMVSAIDLLMFFLLDLILHIQFFCLHLYVIHNDIF